MLGVVLLATTLAAHAETYYVATNGLDSRTGTGDWTNALATISNALAKATTAGDIVLVSNGVFTLNAMLLITNQITLRSLNGSGYTVIDGNYPTRTFRSVRIDDSQAILHGFTISNSAAWQGASSTNSDGGAVWVNGAVLSNCVVLNSRAQRYGGGVYVINGGTIVDCTIQNCSATSRGGGVCFDASGGYMARSSVISNEVESAGGGIYVYNSVISNCFIADNLAKSLSQSPSLGGGGLYVAGATTVTVSTVQGNTSSNHGAGAFGYGANSLWDRCRVQGNRVAGTAGYGGGGLVLWFSQRVVGCSIVSNYSAATGAGWGGGGAYVYRNNTVMQNCTIVANSSVIGGGGLHVNRQSGGENTNHFVNMLVYFNHSDSAANTNYYCGNYIAGTISFSNCCLAPEPTSGYHAGTKTGNPKFVNRETGDYRISAESPCVNAGLTFGDMLNERDMDGHRRVDPFSGIVDIGAYEYFPSGLLMITR